MVLTVDDQASAFALVVSLEALETPHILLLVCNSVRREAEAVMPAVSIKKNLPWTSVASILQKFPGAKHLSFSEQ